MEVSVVPKADDDTVLKNSPFDQWGKVSLEAGDAFGKTLRIVDESRAYIEEAGFENVTEHRYKIPIGGWSSDPRLKEIGRYNRLYWEHGLEGWCTYLLTRYLHWEIEEVTVYIAHMRRMLREKKVHAYHEAYVQACRLAMIVANIHRRSVVYGRKPYRIAASNASGRTAR
jgi:hypothetical protein